jgi:hypothetical protein
LNIDEKTLKEEVENLPGYYELEKQFKEWVSTLSAEEKNKLENDVNEAYQAMLQAYKEMFNEHS